jgi:hypothetical protein
VAISNTNVSVPYGGSQIIASNHSPLQKQHTQISLSSVVSGVSSHLFLKGQYPISASNKSGRLSRYWRKFANTSQLDTDSALCSCRLNGVMSASSPTVSEQPNSEHGSSSEPVKSKHRIKQHMICDLPHPPEPQKGSATISPCLILARLAMTNENATSIDVGEIQRRLFKLNFNCLAPVLAAQS